MQNEEEELLKLKTLYNELWRDAKTMIRDMSQSISMYRFSGYLVLAFCFYSIYYVFNGCMMILAGNTNWFAYLSIIVGALATVYFIYSGIRLLRWHSKLKKRYARLIQMEETIED